MNPKLPRVTSPELVRALRRAGWQPICQTGSHLHLMHPERPGVVLTVAVHAGRIAPLGTLRAILARAGLSGEQLQDLL